MRSTLALVCTFTFLALSSAGLWGCARAANDTSGYAIQDNVTVNAPFDEAWQAMKGVLREQGYDIYTRDKRGIFVAYSPTDRRLLKIVPHRMKYTIEMAEVSSDETKVYIETVKQVYGTTLLTYPDWHDRKAEDNTAALGILDGLQAKLNGVAITPDLAVEAVPEDTTEIKVEDAEAVETPQESPPTI